MTTQELENIKNEAQRKGLLEKCDEALATAGNLISGTIGCTAGIRPKQIDIARRYLDAAEALCLEALKIPEPTETKATDGHA